MDDFSLLTALPCRTSSPPVATGAAHRATVSERDDDRSPLLLLLDGGGGDDDKPMSKSCAVERRREIKCVVAFRRRLNGLKRNWRRDDKRSGHCRIIVRSRQLLIREEI